MAKRRWALFQQATSHINIDEVLERGDDLSKVCN